MPIITVRGPTFGPNYNPADVQRIPWGSITLKVENDALKVICHTLAPRTAAELAISAAQQIDAELDTLTPDLVKQIEEHAEATSTQFRMNRALHRDGHLADIEALLGQSQY